MRQFQRPFRGGQSNWVTSAVFGDSAPSAVFSPDFGTAGFNQLDSPRISIRSTSAVLTFRQNYNLSHPFIN